MKQQERKAVIVTVYNSENCGSFLQAYAMKTFLEKNAVQAAFLRRKTRGTSHAFAARIPAVLKKIAQLRFGEIGYICKPWSAFQKAIKHLTVCDRSSEFYKQASLVVLGSDTIWNFDSAYFSQHAATYLGAQFADKRVISYAASAANTAQSRFDEIVQNNGALKNLETILVRDEHTKMLVENSCHRTAALVADPTLLLTKEEYLALANDKPVGYAYMLLYCFGELPQSLQQSLIRYAKARGLKIVSLLKNWAWCDCCVPIDPAQMVRYFRDATCVVTNTFHGCAFSMIFEKPFAVYDQQKKKVSDILERYGETARLFTQSGEEQALLEQVCEVVSSGRYATVQQQSSERLLAAIR